MPACPPLCATVVRRVPFTLLLAATIFVTTVVTGTLVHPITLEELAAWGFGVNDLAHGRWFQLILATCQIINPYMAVSMLATVLALVGACERRLGTVRTVIVYAVSHTAGAVGMIVVARLFAALGSDWGRMLVSEREVGASAGAIGALAAWLAFLPRRGRAIGTGLCAAFLILSFAGDVHAWDVEHAGAFIVGLVLARWMRRRDQRRGATDVDLFSLPGERRLIVAWIAATVGLVGVLAPFAIADLLGIAPLLSLVHAGHVLATRDVLLTCGVALLAASTSLWSGGRTAWKVALGAGGVAVVALWQPGAPGVEHVLSILLLGALVAWRADFTRPTAVPSPGAAWRRAGLVMVAAVTYVVFGFVVLRGAFVPPFGVAGDAREAIARLRLQPVPEPNWHSPAAMWFLDSLPLFVYGAAGWALANVAWAAWKRRRPDAGQRWGGEPAQSE